MLLTEGNNFRLALLPTGAHPAPWFSDKASTFVAMETLKMFSNTTVSFFLQKTTGEETVIGKLHSKFKINAE